jgi:hypothetical protein
MARRLPCCFSLMARPSITSSLSLNMAAANAFPRRRLNAVPSALQVYVQAPQQFDNHPEDPDSRPKEGSSNNLADLVMRLYEPPACMESIFTMAYPKNRSGTWPPKPSRSQSSTTAWRRWMIHILRLPAVGAWQMQLLVFLARS